jgi:hypothetical protein
MIAPMNSCRFSCLNRDRMAIWWNNNSWSDSSLQEGNV